MSTLEMDGVGSFAASASVVEDLPQPVEGNMQDTLESVMRTSVIEPRVGMEFGSLLKNKVENEILSDFECFKGKLECSSSSPMKKQFQEAYTHEIFKRVRIEFSRRQGCIVKEVVRGGEKVKYKIQDEAATWRSKRLKSSMEEAISKPKKKRNTAAARNVAQSTSTTWLEVVLMETALHQTW
uniref:Uncharacterized protein n=1 Tax=Fagus sylvatica TaxID=28930 RepID=A0A2N9IYH4_FAGSY